MTELGNGCGPEAGMRRRPEVVRRSLDRYLGEEIDGQDWPLATRVRDVAAADRPASRPRRLSRRGRCPVIL